MTPQSDPLAFVRPKGHGWVLLCTGMAIAFGFIGVVATIAAWNVYGQIESFLREPGDVWAPIGVTIASVAGPVLWLVLGHLTQVAIEIRDRQGDAEARARRDQRAGN